MILRQIVNPNPVPPLRRESEESTCWNLSKILSSLSEGMPCPSSQTDNRTSTFGLFSAVSHTLPLTGENLIALLIKFVKA